jgi:hypothetical protein
MYETHFYNRMKYYNVKTAIYLHFKLSQVLEMKYVILSEECMKCVSSKLLPAHDKECDWFQLRHGVVKSNDSGFSLLWLW